MTSEEIEKSAQAFFIEKGYEGASLNEIANEVGIKKQSIYSHFKSKDDLFLIVCDKSIRKEIEFLHSYFSQHNTNLKDFLKNLTIVLSERFLYKEEKHLNFLVMAPYVAPLYLKEQVIQKCYKYYYELEDLLKEVLIESGYSQKKAEQSTLFYTTVLDGLFVALLSGGPDRFKQKLDALWEQFWKGMSEKR